MCMPDAFSYVRTRVEAMTPTILDTRLITTAVELACRAPSLHDSQPWRWVAGASSVDLFVDARRAATSTLDWWTAPLRVSDGIPQSALISESDSRRVDVNRQFPTDPLDERSSAGTYDQAKNPVLSAPRDTRVDALNCGEALSAILLECTMAGLATCPVTHITELEAGRDIIRVLTSVPAAVPQVLIRVGIEPADELAPKPTPRRPVSEVLEIRC